jgi:hypothetical protein
VCLDNVDVRVGWCDECMNLSVPEEHDASVDDSARVDRSSNSVEFNSEALDVLSEIENSGGVDRVSHLNLHLVINSPKNFDGAIGQPPAKVAGVVGIGSMRYWSVVECLSLFHHTHVTSKNGSGRYRSAVFSGSPI